ncbi:hypothetical protein LUZ60_007842 [Juncus effusus]|nr:hypothetical protein LUZ60_007842 [Juncus effusus]
MNGNRQAEIHYINTGFPYTVTESFMDLFEGLSYDQSNFSQPFIDQGNSNNQYWSTMQSNTYKYTYSGEETTNLYCSFDPVYDINEYIHRLNEGRGIWDDDNSECTQLNNSSSSNNVESPRVISSGSGVINLNLNSEERVQGNPSSSSPEMIWQDYIDPDNMTYEELLDLGETVGTQSKGLTKELISLLPISKHKCSFFPKKKTKRERCVICQMDYKRGDKQMTLTCNHVYHASCVTKWLTINKVCPVCFAEVKPEGPRKN